MINIDREMINIDSVLERANKRLQEKYGEGLEIRSRQVKVISEILVEEINTELSSIKNTLDRIDDRIDDLKKDLYWRA